MKNENEIGVQIVPSSNVSFTRNRKFELPKNSTDFYEIPEGFDPVTQNSIETGYFVFTMMPSLRCELNCPHCYLSKEQRTTSPIMTLEQLDEAFKKVYDYYISKPDINIKLISFYWYGGEPTQMGMDYMLSAFKMIENQFKPEDGFHVRHTVLTSLIQIDDIWFDFFKSWCGNYFQTSFDGLMRGKSYMRQWEARVKQAREKDLKVGTISVINKKIIEDTPKGILDYLVELEIEEASFLPMMRNEQNEKVHYGKYAPTMDEYSDFMIELMDYWYELKAKGVKVPQIGQALYVSSRTQLNESSNVAGQTMFLMPDGDFVLPDYKNGYTEYMRTFGNIFDNSFEEVITSKERRSYLRKQYTGNRNKECIGCEHKHDCIMEFWKENREGDECFGAKRFVEHVLKKDDDEGGILKGSLGIMC